MDELEKEYLYWLCQTPFLGAVKIQQLFDYYGSFKDIYNIEEKNLVTGRFLTERGAECFSGMKKELNRFRREYHCLEGMGIRFLTPWDQEYPDRLTHIYGKPVGIYVKGKVPESTRPSVAVIGARNCTSYGKQAAEYFGKALSRYGIQIISGLARGIDGAGQWGAVKEGKDTYGVLGCGINICYPKENYGLYEAILENGGIISELPLGEQPNPRNFPQRNRIISGLADAVLVIEAKEKSGSLITVDYALEQGKEIFALPGRATDALSTGCNQLIKNGANVVTSPSDLIEYFGLKQEKILRLHEKNVNGLAKKEKMVYSCLDLQPKFLEQIVKECGLAPSECMSILMGLELGGYILQTTGNYYVKKI
ncbi:DNA-protecting protein DprA [Clostridium sp. MCC353]|uniref:DNA-processing protein DprA n=1 Tax=Clostridium sp. MCC353 TaxID=2592646 RepID=UPI001C039D6B|nr:DNA-processing protein DprA [Clostridium sp. MCC353]MBT9778298.1 DNA-protecting protein DprA [Clostridium sp. MCC353]